MYKILVPVLLIFLGFSCANKEEKPQTKVPIIKKKASKLEAPGINTTYKLGESVSFKIRLKDTTQVIDSILWEANNEKITISGASFERTQSRVGTPKIKLTAYFNGQKETHYPKIKVLAEAPPVRYTYRVINTYPHDPAAYTQGLFWYDGALWESTGKEGSSSMRKVDLESGEPVKKIDLDPDLFGEGAVLLEERIYQLTWTSQKGFIYDLNLNQTGEFRYLTEGWGITNVGEHLIMSDGTENLYIMEPDGFTEIDRLQVYDNLGKATDLNELENVNGKIYANIYGKEYVAVIDPSSGAIEATIDFEGIWPRDNGNSTLDYVLNGIAYDPESDRLFVTGKWWPKLYEVELLRRGNQP